jgi:hypothetical protein
MQNNGFRLPAGVVSPDTIASQHGIPPGQNGFPSNSQQTYQLSTTTAPGSTLSYPHHAPAQSLQDESLLTLSDTFMDSQFLEMDRVITFEDANFFMPGDFRWN